MFLLKIILWFLAGVAVFVLFVTGLARGIPYLRARVEKKRLLESGGADVKDKIARLEAFKAEGHTGGVIKAGPEGCFLYGGGSVPLEEIFRHGEWEEAPPRKLLFAWALIVKEHLPAGYKALPAATDDYTWEFEYKG